MFPEMEPDKKKAGEKPVSSGARPERGSAASRRVEEKPTAEEDDSDKHDLYRRPEKRFNFESGNETGFLDFLQEKLITKTAGGVVDYELQTKFKKLYQQAEQYAGAMDQPAKNMLTSRFNDLFQTLPAGPAREQAVNLAAAFGVRIFKFHR